MFNIFFQHCFVQILPNLTKFCIIQSVVGDGFAAVKTNGMQILYLSVISHFQCDLIEKVTYFLINFMKFNLR